MSVVVDTPWMEMAEAAAYVRHSLHYWRAETTAGRTPGVKVGRGKKGKWLFNRTALDRWVQRRGRQHQETTGRMRPKTRPDSDRPEDGTRSTACCGQPGGGVGRVKTGNEAAAQECQLPDGLVNHGHPGI